MARSIMSSSVAGGGTGGYTISGVVATFSALPDPVINDHKFYFVKQDKLFSLNGRGIYFADMGVWEKTTMKVKWSEDAGSWVNWNLWSDWYDNSFDVNSGDKLMYQGTVYVNQTGTQTATAPDTDTTNWSSYTDYASVTPPIYKEGRVFYDSQKKALSYFNDRSDVTLNIGQEVLFKVENQSGATIPNGAIISPDKNDIITLANARAKHKSRIIAVMTHEILNGETGYATKLGQVGGLDTSLYAPGTTLYLSENNPGVFTDTTPTDGSFLVTVGVVDVQDPVNGIITVDTRTSDLTVEVTDTNGFPLSQKNNTTLSVDEGTRTFTIAPITGTEFHYYEVGEKFESPTTSVQWTDVEGEHWFYFENGVLSHKENPSEPEKEDVILNNAFVSYIYWNATDKTIEFDIFEERHGISMSPVTHAYLHVTRGSQYVNGIAVGDVLADNTGALDTHAQFSVSDGLFYDEDIQNFTGAKAVGDSIPIGFNAGATKNLRSDIVPGFAVFGVPGGRLFYNNNNAGTWELVEVPNNDFVLYHIFATNGVNEQLISIMGQNYYTTVRQAREGATIEISNITSNQALVESVPIATIIFQTSSSYSNTVKARIRTTDDGADFIDWRSTELAQGTVPSSHANLTDLQLSGAGVTYGHIDDGTQTIAGVKTFTDGIDSSKLRESAIYDRTFASGTVTSGSPVFELAQNERYNDGLDIVKVSDTKITLKAGYKYKLEAFLNCTCNFTNGYVDFVLFNATDTVDEGIKGTVVLATNGSNSGSVVQPIAYIDADTDKDIELQHRGGDDVTGYYASIVISKM